MRTGPFYMYYSSASKHDTLGVFVRERERERETWLAQHVVEADIGADGWVHLHPGRHGVQLPVVVKLIQEFLKNTQHFTNMPMLLSFTPQSVWFSRSYVLREQSIHIDNVFSKPLVIKQNIYA